MNDIYGKLQEHFEGLDMPKIEQEEKGLIVLPVPTNHGVVMVHIIAEEEPGEVLVRAVLGFRVPHNKANQVARICCKLNADLKHGRFDFKEEHGLVIFSHGAYCFDGLSDEVITALMITSLELIKENQGKIFDVIYPKATAGEEPIRKVANLH